MATPEVVEMSDIKDLSPSAEKPKPTSPLKAVLDPARWRLSWPCIALLCALLGVAVTLLIALPATLVKKDNDKVRTLSQPSPIPQTVRTYYIAAELRNWTYVPDNANLCALDASANTEPVFSMTFVKAVYREYKDETFTMLKERSEDEQHLGILGPIIRAEVGDAIHVVFKNSLTFPVNLEPSGVTYGRPAHANPGETVHYLWEASSLSGPALEAAETSSKLWLYRSTVHTTEHTNAGLIGPLIITAKGSADPSGGPNNVDKEFVVMSKVFFEGATPESLRTANNAAIEAAADLNAAFHSINGLTFCNLKGLVADVGSRVRWHVASVGGTEDVHTTHWHGITLEHLGRRMDQIHTVAGATYTLDADMDTPGSWLMHCHVNSHIKHGMVALFTIRGQRKDLALKGKLREYFFAAELEAWSYAPLGGMACSGTVQNFTAKAETYLLAGEDRIGPEYLKARYNEFTDGTFSQRKERPFEEVHLGLLGPLIRAEVGDTIRVTLKNNVPGHPVSLHPHGVQYDKASEGAPYNDGATEHRDDLVQPGETWVYTWAVPERAGPAQNDLSSIVWMYHSHADETKDTNAGLVGAIIISRAGMAKPSGAPKDVDRELVLYFTVEDESSSFLLPENVEHYLGITNETQVEGLLADEGFLESNLMHSINGAMFCNSPGLTFTQNTRARFHVMALGDAVDMHTPNLFGSRFQADGMKRQSLQLLPGTMISTDVFADTAGSFGIKCKVNDHLEAGMVAVLNVVASNTAQWQPAVNSTERRVYIAAELVEWDYAPLGFDGCTGNAFNEEAQLFTQVTNATGGSKFLKAAYREYTDWTFSKRAEAPEYQGILGPSLHLEVGDQLVVTLLNRLNFSVNFQPNGGLILETAPSGEGESTGRRRLDRRMARKLMQGGEAQVGEGTETLELLPKVAPGQSATYTWSVPPEAGPGAEDTLGVVAYTYISTANEVIDTHAGLMGLLLVTHPGGLADDGRSVKGVDLELPVMFNVFNEQETPLVADNLAYRQGAAGHEFDQESEDFGASQQLHAINGFIYCNQPVPVVKSNSTVLVVLAGMGSEDGMHGAVFTGQALVLSGRSDFAPEVMPSVTQVAVMKPQGTGYWEYYCAVTEHFDSGMRARLRVEA